MLISLFVAILFLTPDLSQWKKGFTEPKFYIKQAAYVLFGFMIFSWVINYLILPAHTMYGEGTWVLAVLSIVCGARFVLYLNRECDNDMKHWSVLLLILPVLTVVFVIWSAFSGTFSAKEFHQIAVNKTEIVNSAMESTDIDQIPTVMLVNAKSRALQTMNQVPNYSWYTLGEGSISNVNNKLVWIFPLEYKSRFIDALRFIVGKGKTAGSTPGYVSVSATDENSQATLNLGYTMKYMPSGVGKYNLNRHVHNEFPSILIRESSLEPDDSGKPYWAVSYGHYVRGWFGIIIDGVILVDPQTGEMKNYKEGQIPDFVDQAETIKSSRAFATAYGEYVHGYWNNAKTGVKTVNGDPIGIFSHGKFNYFVTFVSPNNDTSLVGYMLIDGKTGDAKYYPVTDTQISDTKARKFVESRGDFKTGKDETTGWITDDASFYQIYGQPTWVIPVMDKQSDTLVKIAIVNAHGTTADDVILANTTKEAFQMYKSALAKNNLTGGSVPTEGSVTKVVKGTVNRVNPNQVTVSLVGDNTIYLIDVKIYPQATLIEKGDMLEMTVEDVEEPSIAVIKFTNLTFENQIK